jgi:hypothetical protein
MTKRLHALVETEIREMGREGSLPQNRDTAIAQALFNVVLDHLSSSPNVRTGDLMLEAFLDAEVGHTTLADENLDAAQLLWQAAKTAMNIAISAGLLDDTGRTYVHGERPGVSGIFITTMN